MVSRHLDLAARWLRGPGLGYYTIGSAGHEANATVAAALRPTDPALLHYRSGAFYVRRAMQVPGHDARRDVLLGLVAATDEPIAGGRHKVFGHHDSGHHPPDVDDRVPPAPRPRRRLQHRPGPPARRAVGVARRRASPSAASATPRPTTRRPPAPSTPPAGSPTSTCPSRSSSSARTTASGSASAPRPGGSRRGLRSARPTCAGSRPTAPTRPERYEAALRGGRLGPPSSGRPPSCTCGWCASSPTPAPTSKPPTGRRPRSGTTTGATPSSPPPGCWSRPGVATPASPGRALRAHPAPRCSSWPASAPRTPS